MADRITALRARQAEVIASMEGVLNAAGENDLTAEQQEQYDVLRAEEDRLTANIDREVDLERRRAASARPIAPLPGATHQTVPAQPQQKLEAGVKFSRFTQAVAATRGIGGMQAICAHAEKTWGSSFALEAADNMQQSVDVQGGFLVNTDYSSDLIDALRPLVVVRKMGARPVPMPQGNLTTRKKTGTTTAAWGGERDAISTSAPTVGNVTLRAKKLSGLVPITNDLLKFASIHTDQFVRDDLVESMALAEDQQFIRGAGSDVAPTGIRYLANAANLLKSTATLTVQGIRSDLGRMELALTNKNVPMMLPGWILNPTVISFLQDLQTANGNLAFPEMQNGKLRGKPFASTTSVPSNLGDAGNQSELYLCDFAQIMIGDAIQTTLAVSTEASYVDGEGKTRSAFQNDETLVRVIEHVDLGARYDAAISVLTDAAWFPGAIAGQ